MAQDVKDLALFVINNHLTYIDGGIGGDTKECNHCKVITHATDKDMKHKDSCIVSTANRVLIQQCGELVGHTLDDKPINLYVMDAGFCLIQIVHVNYEERFKSEYKTEALDFIKYMKCNESSVGVGGSSTTVLNG